MGEDKGSMIFIKKPMILHILKTLNNQIDEVIIVLNDSNRIFKYKKIIQDNILNDIEDEFNYDLIFVEDEIKNRGPLSGIMTGLENINSRYGFVFPCDSPFVNSDFVKKMFNLLNQNLKYNKWIYDKKSKNSYSFKFNKENNILNHDFNNFNNSDDMGDYDKNDFLNCNVEVWDDKNIDINKDIEAIVPYHHNMKYKDKTSNLKFSLIEDNEIDYIYKLNNSEPLHSIYKKDVSIKIRKLIESNKLDVKSLLKDINTYFIEFDDEIIFKNINTKKDTKDF